VINFFSNARGKVGLIKHLVGRFIKDEKVDVTRLGKSMGDRIDCLAHEIFVSHRSVLFFEHATYIVPAVWGAKKEGALTGVQKDINNRVEPVIRELLDGLGLANPTEEQKFAVEFMIRGLLITKITYMLELGKNMGLAPVDKNRKDKHPLTDIEPLGRA
jgi:hypothetical protein